MKKIINTWNDNPRYNCFGCGTRNPYGLHMEFYEDGDYIVSRWQPQSNYQGWIDTMHGGILSTLIDEVSSWVVTRKMQTCGYTTNLNVKFRKAISTNEPMITVRGKAVRQLRNLLFIHAEILNDSGDVCVEGEVTYYMVDAERARKMGFEGCNVEE